MLWKTEGKRDPRIIDLRPGRLVLAVMLALAVTLAPVSPLVQPASALTCQVRVHRGRSVCWCWNGRWVTAPMALCRLSR